MQPISLDVIEHADDFIFHLSDNQLKEWLDELKKKQPYIFNILNYNSKCFKSIGNINYVNKIQLSMVQCFNSYKVTFPLFSNNDINVCNQWYNANIKAADITDDTFETVKIMGQLINQQELVEYVYNKLYNGKEELILNNDIKLSNLIANCILIIEVYSRRIRKFIPNSPEK